MKILEVLSCKNYISGNEIGRILGISRAAVHKQIKSLSSKGLIVETSSRGYKLVDKSRFFDEKKLKDKLAAQNSVFGKIKYLKKIVSTQTKLKNSAVRCESEGCVLIAEEQSKSYGRRGSSWSSNAGGLWFSMLLKPSIRPESSPKLSLIIGLALNRVLNAELKIKTKIKWTNDILFDEKKIAGTIIEMSAEEDGVNWIVAGIGINCNNKLPDELSHATSLSQILNKSIDRTNLLFLFLSEFEKLYIDFQERGFAPFAREYNQNMAFYGEKVIIDNGYDIMEGINRGISQEGKFLIETQDGIKEAISGTLRKI